MDSGYYAATTGLLARTHALDTAAGNLANAQTAGYRAERAYFRSVLLGADATNSQVGGAVNNYGLVGGDLLNLGQGQLQATGNPLDLAIQGEGFFQIQTPQGNRFTRDGALHRTNTGLLVTARGEPVLSAQGQTITLPPGQIAIGADGVISVDGGVASTVGIFTFPANSRLLAEGVNHYKPPEGVQPVLARSSTVHQGALESANQDVIHGTLQLVVLQRQAEMMERALTVFHTEFNKIACEDLPRVG